MMRATPVRRPMEAKSPRVLKVKGFKAAPRALATRLYASSLPSREACCAVGGCQPPAPSGIIAQSPNAQTPGNPSTCRQSFTLRRLRSLGNANPFSKGLGEVPAVVDAADGLDARKTATGHHKGKQRLTLFNRALGVSFFEVLNQA